MARHVLYEEVRSRQLERVMGIVTEHLLQLRTVFTRKPEGFLQPGVVIAAATGGPRLLPRLPQAAARGAAWLWNIYS